ncbi:MAG: siderophore-interacting protein [Burkholderiaceae bacterium]
MESTQTQTRVERVRHEIVRRDVRVAAVEPLGREFVRVIFSGDSLAGFVSLGFDDHLKFIIETDDGEPVRRDYTPRRFDPKRRELTIDFALHGHGVACDWARRVTVSQQAVIGGPRGSMVVPKDYDWHLLAGDATAAPAMARRLAELPGSARAIVVAELGDLAPLELDRCAPEVELQQVSSASDWVAAIDAMQLPPGDGYVWCAGEARTMARARDILMVDKAHPRGAMRIAAYWKSGATDYHEELSR